jgi:hypothetical protein
LIRESEADCAYAVGRGYKKVAKNLKKYNVTFKKAATGFGDQLSARLMIRIIHCESNNRT